MYTIKDVAERTGLSIYTIRFYDREGLLPQLKRTASGKRLFEEQDICWLELINCLKNSGMSLDGIKTFMLTCLAGHEKSEERKDILLQHKAHILNQIQQLTCSLEIINYKIDHYQEIGIFHLNSREF